MEVGLNVEGVDGMEFLLEPGKPWVYTHSGAFQPVQIERQKKWNGKQFEWEYKIEVPSFFRPTTIYLNEYDTKKKTLYGRVSIAGVDRPITYDILENGQFLFGAAEGYACLGVHNLRRAEIEPVEPPSPAQQRDEMSCEE